MTKAEKIIDALEVSLAAMREWGDEGADDEQPGEYFIPNDHNTVIVYIHDKMES